MTQEEKEAYFAQYWKQDVFRDEYGRIYCVDSNSIKRITNEDYLELRSMDSMTEEEKKWIRNLYRTQTIMAIDFLREKGFAVAFRNYSVKDLIKEGVLKLKE